MSSSSSISLSQLTPEKIDSLYAISCENYTGIATIELLYLKIKTPADVWAEVYFNVDEIGWKKNSEDGVFYSKHYILKELLSWIEGSPAMGNIKAYTYDEYVTKFFPQML